MEEPHVLKFKSARAQAAWVRYQMDLAGVTQVSIARSARCSVQYVNQVVQGQRTGREIKKLIAKAIGVDYFELWCAEIKGAA